MLVQPNHKEQNVNKSFVRKAAASSVIYNEIFTIIEEFHKKGVRWVKYYVSEKSREGYYSPKMGVHECLASEFQAHTQPV